MPKEIVLGDETRVNDYGDFFFKDKGGTEHKIGVKRKNQAELIELIEGNPGRAVSLSYSKFQDTFYIVGVDLLDKEITVDETEITKQQVAPSAPKPTPLPKSDTKNRAFALSYAKDIACAKIQMGSGIPPREILGIAEMFTVYLDKGMPEEALKAYNQIQKELKKED